MPSAKRRSAHSRDRISAHKSTNLAVDVNVRDIFVFGEKRQVKQNRKRCSVCGQDDDFGDTTVEGLGSCVALSVFWWVQKRLFG